MDIEKELEKIPEKSRAFVKSVGKAWGELTPTEKVAVIGLGIVIHPVVAGIGLKYFASRHEKSLKKFEEMKSDKKLKEVT
jgi:hypothetical protein